MRGRTPAALVLCAGLALAMGPAPRAAESIDAILDLARGYSDLMRAALPALGRNPDAATAWAVLYDARRCVVEIDRLAANASIYGAALRDRQALQDLAAGAHLRLALYETDGLEFDKARQEIARARALADSVEAPEFRVEWTASVAGEPGKGLVTRYHLLSLPEFEAALGSVWSRARPVPFTFSGYRSDELSALEMTRSPQAAPGSLDERLLSRGTAMLREALDKGQKAPTVPLPPGLYRLKGRAGTDLDRSFAVPEVSDLDPVVVERARFALKVDPKPGPRGPRLFLNGIEVSDLSAMPYGVYRVKTDEGYLRGAPEVVRFVLGEGIPDKTRTDWTLYVPGGGAAQLSLERAPLGERLFRK